MFAWILLSIGVIGFGLGGYLDLKYTEFPDWLPYSIIISALCVRSIFSFIYNDFTIITSSIETGILFLFFGLILYYLKQWGDGDAWLLGALGFLFPNPSGFSVNTIFPFPVEFLFNFFLVSLFYLIVYSLVLGMKNTKILWLFKKELKDKSKLIGISTAVFFIVSMTLAFYLYRLTSFLPIQLLLLPCVTTVMLLFIYYSKIIEKYAFKRKIKTKDLKVGDVLISNRWRGLRENEVKRLKREKKEVWIKEGVRFAPVFLITMLVSLFYGSLIALFLS